METYPTIPTLVSNDRIIAFNKLDGSNIRAEWTRKNGFSKFGTRRRLLDASEPMLGEAIGLFEGKYADDLSRIFRKVQMMKATVFFEFHGSNSFAGFHEEEAHDVTLFDIHNYKQGLLTGSEFLDLVGDKVETAEVLYRGKANADFIQEVRDGTLDGMTFEGVICKGGRDNRRRPINFKIKSEAWLQKLKDKYPEDDAMFEKLK